MASGQRKWTGYFGDFPSGEVGIARQQDRREALGGLSITPKVVSIDSDGTEILATGHGLYRKFFYGKKAVAEKRGPIDYMSRWASDTNRCQILSLDRFSYEVVHDVVITRPSSPASLLMLWCGWDSVEKCVVAVHYSLSTSKFYKCFSSNPTFLIELYEIPYNPPYTRVFMNVRSKYDNNGNYDLYLFYYYLYRDHADYDCVLECCHVDAGGYQSVTVMEMISGSLTSIFDSIGWSIGTPFSEISGQSVNEILLGGRYMTYEVDPNVATGGFDYSSGASVTLSTNGTRVFRPYPWTMIGDNLLYTAQGNGIEKAFLAPPRSPNSGTLLGTSTWTPGLPTITGNATRFQNSVYLPVNKMVYCLGQHSIDTGRVFDDTLTKTLYYVSSPDLRWTGVSRTVKAL
jgi:hypothetical protein